MMVVKVGGAEGNDIDNVLIDLAPRRDYVLVHGGSNEVDRLAEALGRPTRYITSPSGVVSRYTDKETMEVFTMALAGKMNTAIVARLQSLGAPAIGLSGVDGGLIKGHRKEAVRSVDNGRVLLVKDDHSGTVDEVNAGLVQLLFDAGYVPVVLREPSDPSTLISEIPRERLAFFMNFAYGRMKKKLIAAQEALDGGVKRVVIASSQHPDPVERALEGMGTVIA